MWTPFQQVIEALGGIDQARPPNWQHESMGLALVALAAVLGAYACHAKRAPCALLIGALTIGTAAFHLVGFLGFGDMNLAFDWWYFMLLPLVALAFAAARIEAAPRAALRALAAPIAGTNLVLSHVHFSKQLVFDDGAFVAYALIGALAICLALGVAARALQAPWRWSRSSCRRRTATSCTSITSGLMVTSRARRAPPRARSS